MIVGDKGHGQARTPALPGPWGLFAKAYLACRNVPNRAPKFRRSLETNGSVACGTTRQTHIGHFVVLFPGGNALPDTEAVKDLQLCSVP